MQVKKKSSFQVYTHNAVAENIMQSTINDKYSGVFEKTLRKHSLTSVILSLISS